ncbi:MAG TPA: hypothetical protein VLL52_21485 [Anaerolineae bacterium]|nr:hypothetical protein [Anaerolineae bacterium]
MRSRSGEDTLNNTPNNAQTSLHSTAHPTPPNSTQLRRPSPI